LAFLYRTLLKGLLTILPLTLTIYLLVWFASETEQIFGTPLKNWFPQVLYFPGAGFLIGLTFIFLVGLAVNSYVTQRFMEWLEESLANLPIVRSIYGPIRDVTNLFAQKSNSAQQRVVMVKLMDLGIEVLGLVTRDHFQDLPAGTIQNECVTVFVPFSYGMGGFTLVVPKNCIRETKIPADRAMQLAITGWIKSSK
jgi:uncharacterized membrane protein